MPYFLGLLYQNQHIDLYLSAQGKIRGIKMADKILSGLKKESFLEEVITGY
jgi:hypothetical protein